MLSAQCSKTRLFSKVRKLYTIQALFRTPLKSYIYKMCLKYHSENENGICEMVICLRIYFSKASWLKFLLWVSSMILNILKNDIELTRGRYH